ncbi:MAG: ATP-binding protein [Gammaproteobacteria bacterium]|nr:ATP-binding protein [Gammaproteobacteria bacterium]
MVRIIQSIILDFQELPLNGGTARCLKIKTVHGKAKVCIGVRRSGKSTFMCQIMQKLLENGVSLQNIVHLNFFDDRLYSLAEWGLDNILEAYYSLYPEKKNNEKVFFFFDEIQMILGWEPFVERLMRTENCEVYITGSSARMLSTEIATQMRGRALSWEIFPFSFQEFLDYLNIEYNAPLSTKKQLVVRNGFDDYWDRGGFPEVASLDKMIWIKIHQEYFNTILFRDLVERHDIAHPKALIDLAHWLINNVASLYSINNLTGYLKSLGHKLSKSAISEYLVWLEDAYFFFTVRLFDASLSRSNANPKKIYCIDHALVVSIASGILINSGHLLENLVFIALRRLFKKIYYYKTKNGREIDFIVKKNDHSTILIQVCESIAEELTRKREITALNEAMSELNIQSSIIVTRNDDTVINVESGSIDVVPAWRFLFDLQSF